jgi:hypothetical protein
MKGSLYFKHLKGTVDESLAFIGACALNYSPLNVQKAKQLGKDM